MRRLILSVFLCSLFFGFLHAQDMSDSTVWKRAEEALQAENYEAACSLYVKTYGQMVADYRKINSEDVEDLRKTYSIDELQLKANNQKNQLLNYTWLAGGVLVIIVIGFIVYIFLQNKRVSRSKANLEEAKAMAEESLRNKSLMLSNMSHEIRTPLNALSGFSEVLATDGVDDETRKQCNEVIQLNSELLLKLINDVVNISCFDLANMTFKVEHCEIVALCRGVIQTISAIKRTQAEILLDTDIDECKIETDPARLQQLLINLLVNATKFTPKGTITLSVKKLSNDAVQMAVTDTGCGIPQEKQAKIFERFEKVNEQVQGTGLGLSICRLIIERLKGEIGLDASYTAGCRFVFTHPVTQMEVA